MRKNFFGSCEGLTVHDELTVHQLNSFNGLQFPWVFDVALTFFMKEASPTSFMCELLQFFVPTLQSSWCWQLITSSQRYIWLSGTNYQKCNNLLHNPVDFWHIPQYSAYFIFLQSTIANELNHDFFRKWVWSFISKQDESIVSVETMSHLTLSVKDLSSCFY